MPWQEVSTMSQKLEFIMLAHSGTVSMAELCRRSGISRKTGYKWLERHRAEGLAGLEARSRRPRQSPARTAPELEARIVQLRQQYPAWGGRKLARVLRDQGLPAAPAPSTVTAILHRHGLIDPAQTAAHAPWQRFEHAAPNALWQMDFKGHVALGTSGRCHPLTVLDDHSRFALVLGACADERTETVRGWLTTAFRHYGLPERMTMDNGSCWGGEDRHGLTALTAWLVRLGIRISHSRPYHPQTQGKDERFHRTLNAELLRARVLADLAESQRQFDRYRHVYNQIRPHEALGLDVPASRYQVSPRTYPESLSPIEYGPGDTVRKVQGKGEFSYRGRLYRVSSALHGQPVAIRPTADDGRFEVFFCHQRVAEIDLRVPD